MPVPDDCSSSPFESGVSLLCSLSAINSAVEKTDFGVIPSARTRALTVRCRDTVLSRLDPNGFREDDVLCLLWLHLRHMGWVHFNLDIP